AAKARVLMDELAENRENIYETLDETVIIKKKQKAKQIDRLYSQLERAESEQEATTIKNELKDLEFDYQSFLNKMQANNSNLQTFDYPKPASLSEIQALLNEQTAILEYAFTESGLIRLLITSDNIRSQYTDSLYDQTAKTFFTEQVRNFRASITEKKRLSMVFEGSKELYSSLIPSFNKAKAQTIKNLVIIPDGPLSFLPFEALASNQRFLIEDFLVKYLPSASIYSFIQPPHRLTEYDLLALAGSGFESEQNVASPSRSQASFASLPSTLLEVDSISANFEKSTILKNDDVSEATLKSHDLSNYRFLHFATHANVDEVNPFRSGLLLSKKADVESLFGEDGHLNSREIANLQLKADLVTLSACNTGMGALVTGEGLIGLQRSFLSAGASSVMVSLWSVFDRSTSIFMSDFYQNMLTHQEEDYGLFSRTLDWIGIYEHPMIDYKTKAIRDAKLAMIDHPYYNHPVHWAPFILIGK
ncbi:MAG: CHAT domain-containing protein, partial [Gracilimonas sp.]|nr:CHAT domain-containing protein [Gracilimonas sp.]